MDSSIPVNDFSSKRAAVLAVPLPTCPINPFTDRPEALVIPSGTPLKVISLSPDLLIGFANGVLVTLRPCEWRVAALPDYGGCTDV